jgi:agmatinase
MQTNRPDEPAYAGVGTFQKVPLALDPREFAGADVVVIGAPMDDMVTHRPGARFAPRAIRNAYDGGGTPRGWHIDLGVDPFAELTILDHGDAEVVPGDAYASHRAIRAAVRAIVRAGAVPVVLGGDHSIAFPDISAVAESYEHGKVAVVQFDTHADTAASLSGVKWSHGTPFRHLVDQDVVPGDRLVQVGLRGYWPFQEEWAWAREAGVRWHRMEEVTERGIDAVMGDVLDEIADADHVYLSIDIDVLDPAYAPGTGTPEPGGMTARELLRAVRTICLEMSVAGLEVVEVSPPYDHAEITAMAAHRTILEALSAMALRDGDRDPAPERPSAP